MKTLYFDFSMGAAGDMLTAALSELFPENAQIEEALNALGIPGVVYKKETVRSCGITGAGFTVFVHGETEEEEHHHTHHHAHHHTHLSDIEHIVSHLNANDQVKADIIAVYRLIAEAESRVHGETVEEVHFHEVGAMDAVADVAAVCWLLDMLSPELIAGSPVHVGSGTVRCAHGVLPVPAPATALLLQGIPSYGGEISGELCTPTGAALIRHFVTKFGPQPAMRTEAIGYGMGKKEFERPNCVRAMFGEADDAPGTMLELICNLDDMSAERVAFACKKIFDAGALDVFTVPVQMKKSRPGLLLTALCTEETRLAVLNAIFLHTTTIGVRENEVKKYMLGREAVTENTVFGPMRKKISSGYGVTKEKYEYDDLAAAAEANGLSIEAVLRQLNKND